MISNDVIAIGPFIAAVLVALAVLVVDLVWPGRRGPALVVSLGGLAIVAALTILTGAFIGDDPTVRVDRLRRRVRRRRPDDVPGPAVHRDRGVHDRVRAGLPGAAGPAGRRVLGRPAVRHDRRDAHRRLGGPADPVHRARAHGPARLHARGLPQDGRLLDRGRDQVLPPRLVQLRDLPVRPGVRVGRHGHDEHRRRQGRARRRSPPGRAACRRRSSSGSGS